MQCLGVALTMEATAEHQRQVELCADLALTEALIGTGLSDLHPNENQKQVELSADPMLAEVLL